MSFVLLFTAQVLLALWLPQILLSELMLFPLVFPVLFLFSVGWQRLLLPCRKLNSGNVVSSISFIESAILKS